MFNGSSTKCTCIILHNNNMNEIKRRSFNVFRYLILCCFSLNKTNCQTFEKNIVDKQLKQMKPRQVFTSDKKVHNALDYQNKLLKKLAKTNVYDNLKHLNLHRR